MHASYRPTVPVSLGENPPARNLPAEIDLANQALASGLAHALPVLLIVRAAGGTTETSQEDLAEIAGVSARTVRRWELELEAAGLVVIARRGRANRRRLSLPGVVENVSATCGQPGETGHERPDTRDRTRETRIIRNARACARAEETLRVSSTRGRARQLVELAEASKAIEPRGRLIARPATWSNPTPNVDEAVEALHRRLGAWPNTLREFVLLARDLSLAWGEPATLDYLENLERWVERKAETWRRPGLVLGALRARVAQAHREDTGAQQELFR